jgi:hypothetical protein
MTEDYRAVKVPSGKDPKDYRYTERRAELLSLIEQVGSPRLLNYAAYGRRYGVSREQIRKDVERLGEYLNEATDEDSTTLEGEAFLWKCARSLLEDEEYRKAAQTFLDLEDWRRQSELEDLIGRVEDLERESEPRGENPFRVK